MFFSPVKINWFIWNSYMILMKFLGFKEGLRGKKIHWCPEWCKVQVLLWVFCGSQEGTGPPPTLVLPEPDATGRMVSSLLSSLQEMNTIWSYSLLASLLYSLCYSMLPEKDAKARLAALFACPQPGGLHCSMSVGIGQPRALPSQTESFA